MVGGAVVPEHGLIQIDVAGSRWPDQRYKDSLASRLQTFFFIPSSLSFQVSAHSLPVL